MKTILSMARDLYEDKSGASFIEYTVLLGVILAVGISVMTTMGQSASDIWNLMKEKLEELKTQAS